MIFLVVCLLYLSQVTRAVHHTVLDKNERYHLEWESHEDEITFKVEVATHGYVGFGISPNGGMPGSDVVIGWVKDGKTFFHDRHATGKFLPPIDKHQDWKLISGSENETHTILKFKRKLETCDSEDLPITNDTMRVIFSYHEEDPLNEMAIPYHGPKNRGTRSMQLLQPGLPDTSAHDRLDYWDALAENVSIGEYEGTVYWCKVLKAPILQEKQHVVKISPVIQKGHEGNVHHIILYQCLGATLAELEPYTDHHGHWCYHPNMPPVFAKCDQPYAAWGIGGEDMILPEHVGMPFGEEGSSYFMIELHYDNPTLKNEFLDLSGLRLHYTPHLRKYDAATLMLGSEVIPRMFIPPYVDKYVVSGQCNSQCLTSTLPQDGINAIAVILHSHLLGRSIKVRHFRDEEELPPIASDNHYDFNFQEYHYLRPEIKIQQTDHLTVECTYDSSKRNSTTISGITTEEEMCLAYVLYYPKVSLHACRSYVATSSFKKIFDIELHGEIIHSPDDQSGMYLGTFLAHYSWENKNISAVEEITRMGPQAVICYSATIMKTYEPVTYPPIKHPYIQPNPCQETPKA